MKELNLDQIIESVRNYTGLTRKKPIKKVVEKLSPTYQYGSALPNFGDDAAVIPFKDQYILFATDGMMTDLIINEPYAAGKASVMVTVNDIYSMGGQAHGHGQCNWQAVMKSRGILLWTGLQRDVKNLMFPCWEATFIPIRSLKLRH